MALMASHDGRRLDANKSPGHCGYGSVLCDDAWEAIANAIGLSTRELQVLRGIVDNDETEQEIGDLLGLSRNTVRTYLKRLRAKVGGHSRVQLATRIFAEHSARATQPVPHPP
jgi:DNA-binding CsgD family transcriptional regulator